MELQEGLEPSQTDLQSVVLPFYHCSKWSGEWGSNPHSRDLKSPQNAFPVTTAYGTQDRIRTYNKQLRSLWLYPLSYLSLWYGRFDLNKQPSLYQSDALINWATTVYGGVIQNRTVIASVQATSNEPLYDNPELDYSWMSVLLKIQISK